MMTSANQLNYLAVRTSIWDVMNTREHASPVTILVKHVEEAKTNQLYPYTVLSARVNMHSSLMQIGTMVMRWTKDSTSTRKKKVPLQNERTTQILEHVHASMDGTWTPLTMTATNAQHRVANVPMQTHAPNAKNIQPLTQTKTSLTSAPAQLELLRSVAVSVYQPQLTHDVIGVNTMLNSKPPQVPQSPLLRLDTVNSVIIHVDLVLVRARISANLAELLSNL